MKHIDEAIREQPVRFLDLKYCDLLGRLRHLTMPIERLEVVTRDGVGFDSSSVAGFGSVEASDMILRPDLETAFVDPFAEQPTVSCFADIFDLTTNDRYERDPRFVLAKAVAALKKATGADDVMVLTEFEFYLFNTAEFHVDQASAVYRIDTEELRQDDRTGLGLFKGPAYHVAPPYDRSSDFRSRLASLLMGCGVPVKYHHHEGGRYSQLEIEPSFLPAIRAGDAVQLAKYVVRNHASRCGRSATFMPKPIYGEPGSGMHVHQYLVKDGTSMFGDGHGEHGLSQLAAYYIGGILKHAAGLCGLTNPSTNSYRRLIPGFEAPVLVFFSFANRTAAIRIPGYVRSARKMSIEYRIPDATANPYLSLAAILMAGLDGVLDKVDPGPPMKGRPEEPAASVPMLPTSLGQALQAMLADQDYLTRGGVFPPGLLTKWFEMKQIEVDAIAKRPHPWEFELYYGC